MKCLNIALCLCVFVCAFGCDKTPSGGGAPVNKPSKSTAQLVEIQEKAMLGDAKSAGELAFLYPNELSLYPAGPFWNEIAAENGGSDFQYSYGLYLMEVSDRFGNLRSWYWLGCAARGGNESAAKAMDKQMETVVQTNKSKAEISKAFSFAKAGKWSDVRNLVGVEVSVLLGDPDAFELLSKKLVLPKPHVTWPFHAMNVVTLDESAEGGKWMVLCAQNGDAKAIKTLLGHFNVSDPMAACRLKFWENRVRAKRESPERTK